MSPVRVSGRRKTDVRRLLPGQRHPQGVGRLRFENGLPTFRLIDLSKRLSLRRLWRDSSKWPRRVFTTVCGRPREISTGLTGYPLDSGVAAAASDPAAELRQAHPAPALSRGALVLKNVVGDDNALNFRGALVDRENPCISVKPLNRVLAIESISAVHLDCPGRHAIVHFGGVELGHRGLHAEINAAIFHGRRREHQLPAGLDLGGHVGDDPAQPLKL